MKLARDFLSRFQNLTPPNDSVRKAVSSALGETLNLHVPPGSVSIQNGVAHVKVSSVAKSTIRLNRGKILDAVFERVPKARESLRDIR